MTSRCTKISPKSERGLGHVTPTIFGSTVGYPSDSLASCLLGHSAYTDGQRGEQTLRPALLWYNTKEEFSVVRLTRIIITTIIMSNIRRHCFTECLLNTACGVRLWTTSVLTTLQRWVRMKAHLDAMLVDVSRTRQVVFAFLRLLAEDNNLLKEKHSSLPHCQFVCLRHWSAHLAGGLRHL